MYLFWFKISQIYSNSHEPYIYVDSEVHNCTPNANFRMSDYLLSIHRH